jgi:nitrogen fixation/metabolism regulation signal transduction histidine kinase
VAAVGVTTLEAQTSALFFIIIIDVVSSSWIYLYDHCYDGMGTHAHQRHHIIAFTIVTILNLIIILIVANPTPIFVYSLL